MGTVMIAIMVGLVYSLGVFFFCEEKSLSDAKFSDMKCLVTEKTDMTQCFEAYKTIQYVGMFFAAVFIFAAVVANFVYIPRALGINEILGYTFITSLLGSGIILLVKWTYQPVIKLISSFIFGSMFMGATVAGFGLIYMVNA